MTNNGSPFDETTAARYPSELLRKAVKMFKNHMFSTQNEKDSKRLDYNNLKPLPKDYIVKLSN